MSTLRATFKDIADTIRDKTKNLGERKYGVVIGGIFGQEVIEFSSDQMTGINVDTIQTLFQNKTNFVRVNLPNVTSINFTGASCFSNCINLKSVNLSSLTTNTAGSLTFASFCYGCRSLSSVNLGNVTNASFSSAFYNCSSLVDVDLHNLSASTANYALGSTFYNCSSLSSVNLSNLGGRIGGTNYGGMNNCFHGCTSLEYVYFGNLTSFGGRQAGVGGKNVFDGCTSLKMVDFSQCTAVPTIQATTFINTNNTFKVVVPDSLYESWITKANWSTISNQIIKKTDWDNQGDN